MRESEIVHKGNGVWAGTAYHSASPELKRELLRRIPDDVEACIRETARVFGPLHFVGVLWSEK